MPRVANQTKEPIVVEETGGGSALVRPGKWVDIPKEVFDLVIRIREVQIRELIVVGNSAERELEETDREEYREEGEESGNS